MKAEALPYIGSGLVVLLAAVLLAAERPRAHSPVLVELFTSQGCSSCPPADRLLSRLGDGGLPGGGEVIPLSFHVDYWNYIGWTDPFSSKAWSDRQRRYARALRLDTIYTPQFVIDGAVQVVGSDAEEILREIGRAANGGPGVVIDLEPPRISEAKLEVRLSSRVDRSIAADALELMVALFEKRLVTSVSRGENAARTLANDYVVRELRRALEIEGRPGPERRASVELDLDAAWKIADLGVAAFAQDPANLRIHGAAVRNVE